MPNVLSRAMSAIGLYRVKAPGDVIHDGADNRPTITVRRLSGTGGGLPQASWSPRDYAGLAESGYKRNTDVYACVSLIAQAGKQVRWWDGTGETKAVSAPDQLVKAIRLRERVDDIASIRHEWERGNKAAVLNPRPSLDLLTRAGGPTFVEQWISFMLLAGNAYTEVIRKGAGISMLYLDNPATVQAIENREAVHAAEAVSAWKILRPFGQVPRMVAPWPDWRDNASMVQSKLFNPLHAIYGMAPLESAMLKVDWQNEGATLAKRILQRGYTPGWIKASEDSDWTDEQVATLKERIRHSKALGEEVFLQNAEWHDLNLNLQNAGAGIADQQILGKRDIASIFHVDPTLIGDTTSRTYATYAQSRLALYMEAVIPLLTQFRDDWNRTIGAELQSPLDFDKDAFDAITAARAEATDRVHKLFTSGIISQNEARRDLEYGDVKGGDVFYGPANMVPLGEAEPEETEE